MTATGINVATLQVATGSFVSVRTEQVSAKGGGLKDSFMTRLQNASAGYDGSVQDSSVKTQETGKTEYGKEQVKADSGPKNDPAAVQDTDGKQVQEAETTSFADAGKTDAVQESPNTTDMTGDEEITEAAEVLATLIAQIADILGISPEELQDTMDSLGIEPADLTDPNMAAKLVLNLNQGMDLSDLLVDDDMLGTFTDIREAVSETLENAGITADELKDIASEEDFKWILEDKGLIDENGRLKVRNVKEDAPEDVEEISDIPEDEGFTVEVRRTGSGDSGRNGEGTDEKSGTEASGRTGRTGAAARDEKKAPDPAESFVRGLEKAAGTEEVRLEGLEEKVSFRDIVFQLTEAVRVQISPDNTSLEMNLNPESLGKVSLNVSSKDGVMTAQITTQNEVSKEALASQLQILKENIEAQGVRVEAIEVTVATYTFADSSNAESDGSAGQEQKGRHKAGSVGGTEGVMTFEEAEAERIQREMMEQTGSTVTYVA